MTRMGRNQQIKDIAIASATIDGIECWAVPSPLYQDFLDGKYPGLRQLSGLNGYACFPAKPVKEPDYDGILSYIPVHGGITYAHHDELGSVYGFDTGHIDSDYVQRIDSTWIFSQCEVMIRAIKLAATLEDQYLLAEGDNAKRAEICQQICDIQPSQSQHMGVMLHLLGGQL